MTPYPTLPYPYSLTGSLPVLGLARLSAAPPKPAYCFIMVPRAEHVVLLQAAAQAQAPAAANFLSPGRAAPCLAGASPGPFALGTAAAAFAEDLGTALAQHRCSLGLQPTLGARPQCTAGTKQGIQPGVGGCVLLVPCITG